MILVRDFHIKKSPKFSLVERAEKARTHLEQAGMPAPRLT
jgi:hypothetical protein